MELAPSRVGAVLLAAAAGSPFALPMAGLVVNKVGAARTAICGALVANGGLLFAGFGVAMFENAAATVAGLLAFGYGFGLWDVAINVEGASDDRLLGRSIMSRFHAAWNSAPWLQPA